ncbi:retrovirus-related pol polyprotein from transposon TNT 1-94 [Tanacetum coccineum]
MKEVFDQIEAEVDQHTVDKKCDEIEQKNLLTENENLITDCLSKDVFYTATNYVLTISRFSDMHDAYTAAQKLTSSDTPTFESVFEIRHLKEQLQGTGNTIRELKAKISCLQKKHSKADLILDFKALDSQNKDLNAKVNALQDLNERFRVENEKIKQHYKELYDSIKLTRAKTVENITSLLTKTETLKAQIKGKTKCVTMPNPMKPKVLAPGTLREIVEEAKVEKPLDSSFASACLYTKHSLELLEYVIGTCPKDFNKRDRKIATAPLNRKKVKNATATSRSKPRSNTKKDRTLPAKSDMKKVEGHSRNNKSSVKQKNRVDSSISFKCTVINSNSTSVCKTYNKCLMSFNHDKCVVKSLKLVKKSPVNKQPTGRKFTLGEQCPLTRFTKSKVVPAKQPKSVSTSKIVITERLSNTFQKLLTRTPTEIGDPMYQTLHTRLFSNACRTDHPLAFRLRNDHFGAIMGYGDYVIGDNLEVAFRKHSCYVRDVNGVDLIKGNRDTNLYTIYVEDMMKSSPICLLSKASKNKLWLWHRRLNHLNFGTINDLARKDLKYSHKPESENTNLEVFNTLHMDLCGPMRVQTINGKKYILVIVDDYSRFTWVKFLRSKDETPYFVIKFLKQIKVGLNKTVRYIRTDNGTEFVNKVLTEYYESVSIFHQKSVSRTPQQNGVVKRQNHTLVEAARTMLIFSKALMFLWAEAVATACYTQNRSLIYTCHNKTPYELLHDKKHDLKFLCVFYALCYATNDSEDLGKLRPTTNIGIFVGYAPIRRVIESTTKEPAKLWKRFTCVERPVPHARAVQLLVISAGTPSSTTINQDAPLASYSLSSSIVQPPISHQGVAAGPTIEDNPFAQTNNDHFVNVFSLEPSSDESSSRDVNSAESTHIVHPHTHLGKWSKDHPLDNVIGNPSRPVDEVSFYTLF